MLLYIQQQYIKTQKSNSAIFSVFAKMQITINAKLKMFKQKRNEDMLQ